MKTGTKRKIIQGYNLARFITLGLDTKLHVTVSVYILTVKTNEATRMAQPQIQVTCTKLRNNYFINCY